MVSKKYQTYKPGSVESYHLSSPDNRDQAVYPLHLNLRRIGEQPTEANPKCNLFDLSTRKVYHAQLVALLAVVSYTPFSPLP
jgi:hypothetical protein